MINAHAKNPYTDYEKNFLKHPCVQSLSFVKTGLLGFSKRLSLHRLLFYAFVQGSCLLL